MRKLLLKTMLLLCALIVGSGTAWAQSTTKTFDFSFSTIGSDGWSNSYAEHYHDYSEGRVTFSSASKQSGTISDIPVTKGQPVSFVMEDGYTISAVTFTCRQWSSKAQTITLKYSTNKGTSYSTLNPSVTSTNFSISSSSLPEGTNAVQITFSSTSNQVGVASVELTYSSGGSGPSAAATTTTIDASGITNTDVYTSTEAGTLSATVKDNNNTAISGATVTWSGNNDDVATINSTTGAVTLVGAGTVTFTANYAGVAGEYQASSATYEMTVTSSAPYVQPTEFDINLNNSLFGTNYNGTASGITDDNPISGSQDNVVVTYAGSGNHYVKNDQIRVYPSNKLTFEAPSGYNIKKIVITSSSTSCTLKVGNTTIDPSDKTWEGEASSVVFEGSGNSGNWTMTKAAVTLEAKSTDPAISASDVDITYDATGGSITYTLENATGNVSATVTTGNWLTLGTITSSAVPFTCEANTGAERTATVTLSFSGAENKVVTVTQAAAPVVYTTIPALFDKATEVGTTATNVNVTFGNWVVSGVSGSNAFVTDNSGNGFIIYTSNHGFTVNDKLSGTVSETPLKLYNGSAEFTNLTSSTTGLTVSNDGEITVITNKTIANLGGVNTGAVITLSNLTYDGTNLSDGTNTIKPYNTLFSSMSLTSGKTYNITGVYQQFNSTKEILPRSAADIEEVVVTTPSISVSPASANVSASSAEGTLTIAYNNLSISDMTGFTVQYYDAQGNELQSGSEPTWLEVLVAEQDPNVGEGYVVSYTVNANDGEARTAYFKVFALDDNDYVYSNLVTVSQAAYVPDYATLPFIFNGGKSDIEDTAGLTQDGIDDKDYASSPKLKFNNTNDYLVLKLNEDPGMVRFAIKGNDFSGGTFTVQTSADGESYSNLESYTELGNTYENLVLDPSVRYIKWIYTEKVSGNVGIGNIQVSKRQNVSVSSAKYATFSSTNPIDFTEEDHVYAYIAKATANWEEIKFERTYKVPANTGVLLYSENGAVSLSMPILLGNASDVTGNLFVAATTEIAKLASESNGNNNYILNNGVDGIGFYLANDKKVGAGKAYLAVPKSAVEVRSFVALPGGINTGIQTSDNLTIGQSDNCYDLQGRRISTPKNGLYIVNGKKVLVK